jgi:hypothetical protein
MAADPDDEPSAGNDDGLRRLFDFQGSVVRGLRLNRDGQIIYVDESKEPKEPFSIKETSMTTTVQIVVPKPNHKRVRVQVVNPADGTEYPGKPAVTVEHGTVHTEYVHSGQRLIIDEID